MMPATNPQDYPPTMALDIVIDPTTQRATFPCCGAEVHPDDTLGCQGSPELKAYGWAIHDGTNKVGVSEPYRTHTNLQFEDSAFFIYSAPVRFKNGNVLCPQCGHLLQAPGTATLREMEGKD